MSSAQRQKRTCSALPGLSSFHGVWRHNLSAVAHRLDAKEGWIALTKRSRKRVRQRLFEGSHVDAFEDRIDLSRRPGIGEVPTGARRLCDVGYAEFGDLCPLCTGRLASVPAARRGSAEHIPPHAMGGVVHTRTCVKCNAGSALARPNYSDGGHRPTPHGSLLQVCQAFELAVMFYSGPLRTGNLRSLYPAPPPMVCMAY